MILRALNFVLPVLSSREEYGLELKRLEARKKRVTKKVSKLTDESLYLEGRIKALKNTIDTIGGEPANDPVDNTPTLGG